jgi:hypothetical protein
VALERRTSGAGVGTASGMAGERSRVGYRVG